MAQVFWRIMCWLGRHREDVAGLQSDGRGILICRHCGKRRVTHDVAWFD